jgi:HlyD family secretion protein
MPARVLCACHLPEMIAKLQCNRYHAGAHHHLGRAMPAFAQRGVVILRRMLNKRNLSIVAALLLGLAVAAAIPFRETIFGHRPGASETPSSVGQPPHTIAALGRIEPQSEIINLGAGSAPDRLDLLFVERGDLVKKGEVLGYLGGYAEQIAQRDLFRAQLDEAKSRLLAERAVNLARVRAAELNQRRILELSPHRIAAEEATIAGLEAKHAHEKDVLAAREHLSELKQQFEIDQKDAVVQIDLARAGLDRVKAEFPVASLEHQVTVADARAKRLTLYAPCDCHILNVRIKSGEDIGSGPILTLGDTARMRVVAEVYETDIAQMRVGQAATVSSRALAKPINGKVVRIGNMVFKNDVLNVDPAARADARVVEVWIDLDDAAPVKRLTNLTVDVLITTSEPRAEVARPLTR